MHWPSSSDLLSLEPQGLSGFDRRTPFSRASVSKRIGMKEAVVPVSSALLARESWQQTTAMPGESEKMADYRKRGSIGSA